MTAKELRAKRRAHDITGDDVRKLTGHSSGYFSELERGLVENPAELERVATVLDQIISNRAQIAQIAAERGISLAGTGIRV